MINYKIYGVQTLQSWKKNEEACKYYSFYLFLTYVVVLLVSLSNVALL